MIGENAERRTLRRDADAYQLERPLSRWDASHWVSGLALRATARGRCGTLADGRGRRTRGLFGFLGEAKRAQALHVLAHGNAALFVLSKRLCSFRGRSLLLVGAGR